MVSAAGAAQLEIQLKTSPPAERLRPFFDPATISVETATADGKPVVNGQVKVTILAPDPGRFFSTDFPLIEGTELLVMSLPVGRQGIAEWKYLFPIRGEYRVVVEAT